MKAQRKKKSIGECMTMSSSSHHIQFCLVKFFPFNRLSLFDGCYCWLYFSLFSSPAVVAGWQFLSQNINGGCVSVPCAAVRRMQNFCKLWMWERVRVAGCGYAFRRLRCLFSFLLSFCVAKWLGNGFHFMLHLSDINAKIWIHFICMYILFVYIYTRFIFSFHFHFYFRIYIY